MKGWEKATFFFSLIFDIWTSSDYKKKKEGNRIDVFYICNTFPISSVRDTVFRSTTKIIWFLFCRENIRGKFEKLSFVESVTGDICFSQLKDSFKAMW